jgi:small-conductance mechanosensitive channel
MVDLDANIIGQISLMDMFFAIVTLVVGVIAVRIAVSLFKRTMGKTKLPDLIVEFLSRFLAALLYVVVLLFAVSFLTAGVGSVILALSAILGLILGFGMQDSFNNIAAGVWIAVIRPIDKDEVVTVSGMTGKVSAVGLLATELVTPDNQYLTIPNKIVWGSPVINYTRMPTRRVDVAVGIAYGSPVDKAIAVAIDLMKGHEMVLDDPEPAVVVTELADSSVNLQLRPWTNTENYWAVKGALTKGILEALQKEGIEIPFPQLDVHMSK